jgi:hypothetical protein
MMRTAFDLLLWLGIPLALFFGWASRQPVGTRSVLYGAHCWFIHPWFVAAGWWKLWGFQRVTCPSSGVTTSLLDWRLWLAFLVHDLGYWGCPNMDGEEGEDHPRWGASVMFHLADRTEEVAVDRWDPAWPDCRRPDVVTCRELRWHDLALYHSRYYAKRDGRAPSLLCCADKLAIAFEPGWLYLPRALATGEAREYIALAAAGKYADGAHTEQLRASLGSARTWHAAMTAYCRDWALAHYQGQPDTWTPEQASKGVA